MKFIAIVSKKVPRPYFIILFILMGIVLGHLIFVSLIAIPTIGIVEIKGTVFSSDVDTIVTILKAAKDDRAIKAIVLEISSPGGEASNIEEVYMNILAFRESKPVVASVDRLAASGGYYIATAANFIYAKPSSDVGNIGVFSILPRRERIDEDTIITGPFKRRGKDRKTYAQDVQQVAESFLRQVLLQRSGRLVLSKEELAEARLYQGTDAVTKGLIDAIGSRSDAQEKAAELAGLRNYNTRSLLEERSKSIFIWLAVNETLFQATNTVPIHYYLYVSGAG